jgi:hypothetical protein
MKHCTAKIVSSIGHPILTIPMFVVIRMFATEEWQHALLISAIIVGGVFIPMFLWLWFKSRNGSYTHFYVSDRRQRKSFYYFTFPLLLAIVLVLYFVIPEKIIWVDAAFGMGTFAVMQMVNFKLKGSLHVAFNVYLAFLLMQVNISAGMCVLFASPIIGWSRVALKRHTVKEVLAGGAIGLFNGLMMFLLA